MLLVICTLKTDVLVVVDGFFNWLTLTLSTIMFEV